ncbi:hypothetical protein ACT89R_01875 [Rhodococcus qingshengii]
MTSTLLTYEEAGAVLGVTGKVVAAMARKGLIDRIILTPRQHRIHPDDLEKFIAKSRSTAA